MVPPPQSGPAGPPENAIELTASSLGDSHPKRVPQVPLELQEPAPSDQATPTPQPAPPVLVAGSAEPTAESPWIEDAVEAAPPAGHGLEDDTHPRAQAPSADRFPVGDEEPGFPVEAPAEPPPFAAPLGLVPPIAPLPEGNRPGPDEASAERTEFGAGSDEALFIAPEPMPTIEEAMGLDDPLTGAPATAPVVGAVAPVVPFTAVEPEAAMPVAPAPVETVAPAPALAAMSEGEVERIARRVLESLPVPVQPPLAVQPPVAPEPAELTPEQLERIARKVLELSSPQIERIAWEIIPDMAEMLVRKRIADLEQSAEEEA
jgi:hypothetical protein